MVAAGIALVCSLVATGTVYADAIYKSVDAEGNVTYSTTPPTQGKGQRVQELRIQTGPTAPPPETTPATPNPEQQAAAIRTAQQALIRAKAELEQTKIQGNGDWQPGANGGKVLSAEYTNRVAAAEAQVEAAEQDLQRARQP